MKKLLLFLGLVLLLAGCGTTDKTTEDYILQKEENTIQSTDGEVSEIEQARKDVIEKFKNERDVLGTGKFIEDTYKKYPDDEVISTIYNYDSARTCIDAYNNLDNAEWLDKAKSYASKISSEYSEEFSNEIISFVSKLLGDDWQAIKNETAKQEERFKNLTLEDKKEINKFIESRYEYYDKQDGGNTGDKYSDEIWKEASEKYNLAERYISEIWLDTDVTKAIAEENAKPYPNKDKIEVYDAILNFKNGSSLIAVDEETIDRFMDALVRENKGTINELYENNKIAEVPKGTKVNIIERKLTRAKVKILEGIYKDNEVWVLIESIQN
ncbi:MAG: hypothetical protein ACOX8W_07080 [bacterium]|jgi:hypothetical protein